MALAPGDILLVRTKALEQDHIIADKWEHDLHVVVSQMGNHPVFKVQPKKCQESGRTWNPSLEHALPDPVCTK